ncbi:hypothetical protein MRB53_031968 [Persea americana]|uniref:Uncharacterized protein n=1 Tax=Persea americana TaxID=3435 RepID=A0ACC2KQH5_PERAE|nr:hypothetical protein MRB53_031968 [Persea americana]
MPNSSEANSSDGIHSLTPKQGVTAILTTVTSTASDVSEWISKIRYIHRFRIDRIVVGLGVQWRPSFSKGVRNPAATLQLCVGRHCLIFQLIHADYIPKALRRFLRDDRITFVGVGIGYDEFLLSNYDFCVMNTVELRRLAAVKMDDSDLRGASMETLASQVLDLDNVVKPIEIGKSNWDAYQLSLKQVQYACIDAHVSFEIGKELEAWEEK